MPVYEYECDNCSLRFEKLQRFSEEPLRQCPDCGGPVHRVIQPVGIIFKGSGFYVTDNRGKSSTMPPTKRDGDAKGDGDSKGDSGRSEPSTGDSTSPPKSTTASAPAT